MTIEEMKAKRKELLAEANKLTGKIRVEENNKWPQLDCPYYHIGEAGYIYEDNWLDSSFESTILNYGNVFRTRAEAEYARDKIHELLMSLHDKH